MIQFVFAFLILILLVVFWIVLYDSTHFETTHMVIRDPRIEKSLRAVVLSDLHNQCYGKENDLLLEEIKRQFPDVILVAGDLPTARPGAKLDIALHLMKELAKDYPICYANGNHEHRMALHPETYKDMYRQYEEGLKEVGVVPLLNESRELEGTGIRIYGSLIDERFYKRLTHSGMEEGYLDGILGKPDPEEFTVLLAHNPDYFKEYAAWGADLVLSGHVHGGVGRVPFLNKGIISPSLCLFPKYDGGLFREGNASMILSRGLGSHTIPVRFWNPGELIVLSFEKGDSGVEKRQAGITSEKKLEKTVDL